MSEPTSTETTQYLTFKLAEEVFAVEISKVREVLEFSKVTKVPRTSGALRGVINLRGSVVPVIDLRVKFGLSKTEKKINTCVIIIEIIQDDEPLVLGTLADSVQEVVNIEPSQIEPPPKIGTNINSEFLKGMGKHQDSFILMLDMDKLFSTAELATQV